MQRSLNRYRQVGASTIASEVSAKDFDYSVTVVISDGMARLLQRLLFFAKPGIGPAR